MINRADIEERVREWGLREDIVEKDYVLGWILAGIATHPLTQLSWVFKGGTCLKKCFFETYRFSEDLDFTIIGESPDTTTLLVIFREIALLVYERSGIEIPLDELRFDAYTNPRGHSSIQGKLSYRGPLLPRGSLPRIKLDLTNDEILVQPPVRLSIAHSYPDELSDGGRVLAYSHVEIFAEKIRALAERLRPRDLYDVVNLFRHAAGRPPAADVLNVLTAKCAFKGIAVPTFASLNRDEGRDELDADWGNMLAHQLPALPAPEHFWAELPELFSWLDGTSLPRDMPHIPVATNEDASWVPAQMISTWGMGVSFEYIRFAAINHLCIKLDYQGSTNIVEPYSLRRTHEGHLLLHTLRTDTRELHSYQVDRITDVQITKQQFTPVYAIEFALTSLITAPD